MKLVPSGTLFDPPYICSLCEGDLSGPKEQVVDTEYQTRQGQILAGRKYVCEKCIVGLASALHQHNPDKEKKDVE